MLLESGYQGEFIPFPSGSRLIAINDDQGTITVNLSKELHTSAETATAAALTLTLHQFKGVRDIRLQVEGKEIPLNTLAKNAGDSAVRQPSPPRLLSVTAMRDKGARDIEDVNAFFDRPVEVTRS
jgi:germination protein M